MKWVIGETYIFYDIRQRNRKWLFKRIAMKLISIEESNLYFDEGRNCGLNYANRNIRHSSNKEEAFVIGIQRYNKNCWNHKIKHKYPELLI